MNIEIVNLVYIDSIWEHVGPMLQRAQDKCGDDISVGQLWQMCRSGNAFLVIVKDDSAILMSCVVQFQPWSRGTVLRVLTLAGSRLEKWQDKVKTFLNDMGRSNGAIGVVAEGRDGWAAIFDEPKKLRSTYFMEIAQ